MKADRNFERGDPPSLAESFLCRIESANPNDSSLDEDNTGLSFGHYQFTAGSVNCVSVFKSWADIGNTDFACRLLAAAIRTSRIARAFCKQKNIAVTGSFLSDSYVEIVVNHVWKIWSDAHQVRYSILPYCLPLTALVETANSCCCVAV